MRSLVASPQRCISQKNKKIRRRWRGQGLVELALVLPLLLVILLGIIDLGRVFFAYAAISNAAYEAARQAARGGYLYQPCAPNTANTACDAAAMQTQLCPSTDPTYQSDAKAGQNYRLVTIYATLKCELGAQFNDYVSDTSHTTCTAPQSPDPTATFPTISSPDALTPPVGNGCVGWGYTLSTDASGAQEVTVTITYNFALLTPLLLVSSINNYLTLERTVSVAVLTAPGNVYPTPTP
ncbi:MAG TPA: TadE/TadG family type IV pilus assembly protein [Ktedonobacterales bacterium]|nr:TadE/TadG family type IV pilus assembly protein [Ktedonobacterales bacterium]